jgi:hypothetical protein
MSENSGTAGTTGNGNEVLRQLLEEQQKKLTEVKPEDDEKSITQKLLKKANLKEPNTNWTTANPELVQEPLCYFFLITKESGQAIVAINSFLQTFPQRHLVHQASSMLLPIAAACAFAKNQKISTYEAFTIAEPLLQILHSSVEYLQAKKIAEMHRMTAREAGELISATRKDDSLTGRIEEQARRIAGRRRHRSRSR